MIKKMFVFRDPNTIFRGNSLTSKCIDETMKLAGKHYLQVTLKPIIDEVSSPLLAEYAISCYGCLTINNVPSQEHINSILQK